jgi:hypothetical protein
MKIHGNDNIQKQLGTETKPRIQPSSGQQFDAILKESVEKCRNTAAGPLLTTSLHSSYRIPETPVAAANRPVTIERLEHFLDVLDQFRQQLADTRVTLKKIDPIMQDLIREKENLSLVLDSLPAGDKLKDIVNRTLITASLEMTRFYRGDYLPS